MMNLNTSLATSQHSLVALLIPLMIFGWITAPPVQAQQQIDGAQLLHDIKILAADEMEGREAGTVGNRRARAYILTAFTNMGLDPLNDTYLHTFPVELGERSFEGVNIIGKLRGETDSTIVISAHYDHLGVGDEGQIYNGADDNASGVGGLLALAEYFSNRSPRHTIIFAAFDAEEMGLLGARAFMNEPTVPLEQISLNLNLDMISRNADDELFAVGTFHYPFFRPLLEVVGQRHPIRLIFGHDNPDHPEEDDWTFASDHGPFHEAGIPFIYFGVEDHPGYHHPTDTYENITPGFYIRAVDFIRDVVEALDRELPSFLGQSTGDGLHNPWGISYR